MRTIQTFEIFAKNSPVYGSLRFSAQARCFRSHFEEHLSKMDSAVTFLSLEDSQM